jgi:hypothetical protein
MEVPHVEEPTYDRQPELEDLGKVASSFITKASNSISQGFNNMTTEGWIRLTVVVGGYLLLRPYIMRFLGTMQVDEMERQDAKSKAEISPSQLRGETIGGESLEEYEEDDGEATGSTWGQRARTRQRVMLKNLMEAAERQRQEEEDDKDIADLLED